MAIEITEATVALWYFELGGGDNYLAELKRTAYGHQLTYRFRYSGSDPRPFEGNDRRSWYVATISDRDSIAVLGKIRRMVSMLANARAPERRFDEILMGSGSVPEFMEKYAAMPWANIRLEPPD